MSVSIDVSWKSLNKHGEELCGDKVEIVKTEDSDIVILADGMGSGVKANILSTLTSKILATMVAKGAAIEDCVETIAKTLPICRERQVAYATFSVLQIFRNGEAFLAEFDNPNCIFIRDNKLVDYPYTTREIAGKTVREYRCSVKKNDCFVLMSDGVIYAGAGEILDLNGWTWESVAEYALKSTKETLSASRLAAMISGAIPAGAAADFGAAADAAGTGAGCLFSADTMILPIIDVRTIIQIRPKNTTPIPKRTTNSLLYSTMLCFSPLYRNAKPHLDYCIASTSTNA